MTFNTHMPPSVPIPYTTLLTPDQSIGRTRRSELQGPRGQSPTGEPASLSIPVSSPPKIWTTQDSTTKTKGLDLPGELGGSLPQGQTGHSLAKQVHHQRILNTTGLSPTSKREPIARPLPIFSLGILGTSRWDRKHSQSHPDRTSYPGKVTTQLSLSSSMDSRGK